MKILLHFIIALLTLGLLGKLLYAEIISIYTFTALAIIVIVLYFIFAHPKIRPPK